MVDILFQFTRVIKPGLILLAIWVIYLTIIKKDRAVGLAFFVGLVIIMDSFYMTGIFIPGMEYGSIKYSEVLCIFLFLYRPKANINYRVNKLVLVLIAIYFFIIFFAAFRGYTFENGMQNFRRLIVPHILAMCVVYGGFIDKKDYNRFFFYMMILIIILGIVTAWDVFFDRNILHGPLLDKQIYLSSRKHGRFGSLFLNPNYMGAFSVLMFPTMFILTFMQKTLMKRIFFICGLLLFIFAFIKTQSRMPMIGFGISMMFFVFMPTAGYSFFRKMIVILIFVFILSLFLPGFYRSATKRFDQLETETTMETASRKSIWAFTINNLIKDYPLFGIGFGEAQYIHFMTKYGFTDEYGHVTMDHPHNSYISIAVMTGCPNVLVFILISIIVMYKNIYFLIKNKKDEISLILLGITSGLVGFHFCLMTNAHLFTSHVGTLYWLMLILSLSISSSGRIDKGGKSKVSTTGIANDSHSSEKSIVTSPP